jgi:Fic family protein
MTPFRRFDDAQDMEPLLPADHVLNEALEKAHDLRTEATRLTGAFPSDVSRELAALLRSMNSYYSNKIEGEHTRPVEIQRALADDFSGDADKARLQRLALAHIETERWLYESPKSTAALYTTGAVQDIHAHLFGQLAAEDRRVERNAPDDQPQSHIEVQAGQLRDRDVAVHRHVAPIWPSLPAMLARWCDVYSGVRRGEMQIVAAAAAHHRLTWIHPFFDGNGRAARLHTLAVLQSMELTAGLWSPLRGLARNAAAYGEHLANADMPRMGDLDGRGQRSERMLVAWIDYFLDICLDQVRFMRRMLDIGAMESRMGALLAHEEHIVKRGIRVEALRPLHYLFSTRSGLPRGEFARMTGLGERTAVTLIGKLLGAGLLVADSPRGPVRMGIPLDALRFLFPNLWPEAEADVVER